MDVNTAQYTAVEEAEAPYLVINRTIIRIVLGVYDYYERLIKSADKLKHCTAGI